MGHFLLLEAGENDLDDKKLLFRGVFFKYAYLQILLKYSIDRFYI
jgi:hypothetical protein